MVGYILGAAAGILAGYSIFVERTALGLTRLELSYSQLPRSFDGFTILQISDLHISHWWKNERQMEKIVRSLDTDLLVFTGDNAVNSRGARLLKEFLNRVRPDHETYLIYGNTENKGITITMNLLWDQFNKDVPTEDQALTNILENQNA